MQTLRKLPITIPYKKYNDVKKNCKLGLHIIILLLLFNNYNVASTFLIGYLSSTGSTEVIAL